MLQDFHAGCTGDGEHYVPMRVDPLLDNPEMVLRQVGSNNPVLDLGPSGADLYGRGTGTYLDLPGDALAPGCIFADDSARYTPLARSAVYAHVATQANRPGDVAVQYWLYWYYNDWNDKHESDWEFVQVLFKAASVAAALARNRRASATRSTPAARPAVGLRQAREEGDPPGRLPSQGSHASYFEPASSSAAAPARASGATTPRSPKPARCPGGPCPTGRAGPATDCLARVRRPLGRATCRPVQRSRRSARQAALAEPGHLEENLRPSSFVIPGGSETPPKVVGTFCDVVGRGSVLYVRYAAQPGAVLATLAAIGLLLLFLLRRTRWDKVPPYPVVMRRRSGQLARAAATLYRRHVPAFFVVGLLGDPPIGGLAVLDVVVLQHLPFVGTVVQVSTEQAPPGNRILFGSFVASSFWLAHRAVDVGHRRRT